MSNGRNGDEPDDDLGRYRQPIPPREMFKNRTANIVALLLTLALILGSLAYYAWYITR